MTSTKRSVCCGWFGVRGSGVRSQGLRVRGEGLGFSHEEACLLRVATCLVLWVLRLLRVDSRRVDSRRCSDDAGATLHALRTLRSAPLDP